jgi:hypothetical protein
MKKGRKEGRKNLPMLEGGDEMRRFEMKEGGGLCSWWYVVNTDWGRRETVLVGGIDDERESIQLVLIMEEEKTMWQ